ncbi:xylulokinase [Paenibacillus ihumii]|uniref:xylulokinase n=1 Tax=Paenibacillus ihumii TaxID=687436 RepID=UPI0006D7743E|nr:xylulokinase [Paenibacillus ihumii]
MGGTRQALMMGVDLGTTAIKVIVMTPDGQVSVSASGRYPTRTPRPGWVEQNPEDWWEAAVKAIQACTRSIDSSDIAAVSFSGHMSAQVLLDHNGNVLLPSILVADARSAEETRELRERYMKDFVDRTGNEPIDAFTVSKLLWIRRHHPDLWAQAGVLMFPKDFIRYKLTGEIGTEPTDAGNSLLFDLSTGGWSRDLMEELGLRADIFAPILSSSQITGHISGEAAALTGLLEGTPVVTGAADMACSQLGTGATQAGTLAVTLSTSAQVVLHVDQASPSAAGRVTFHPSAVQGSTYAMGTVFTGGLGVDWGYRLLSGKSNLAAEDFEAISSLSARMEEIQPGSSGLMFMPFLGGSGTPYFDPRDRASWLGLSTGQPTELLLHSIMEGIAYNIRESMEVFQSLGQTIHKVHLGGGGSRNKVWAKMIGDVLGKDVFLLNNRDASALGAAMLAGVGCGIYPSIADAVSCVVSTSEPEPFSPSRHQAYDRLYHRYLKAYRMLNEFYREA